MLIDSQPLKNVEHCKNLRYIGSVHKKKLYGKYTNSGNKGQKYRGVQEIAVRNFLKGLLATPPLFNLNPAVFLSDLDILDFIQAFNKSYKYSEDTLARYKHRDVKVLKMLKSKESDVFVQYVKTKFVDFDEESFYRLGFDNK